MLGAARPVRAAVIDASRRQRSRSCSRSSDRNTRAIARSRRWRSSSSGGGGRAIVASRRASTTWSSSSAQRATSRRRPRQPTDRLTFRIESARNVGAGVGSARCVAHDRRREHAGAALRDEPQHARGELVVDAGWWRGSGSRLGRQGRRRRVRSRSARRQDRVRGHVGRQACRARPASVARSACSRTPCPRTRSPRRIARRSSSRRSQADTAAKAWGLLLSYDAREALQRALAAGPVRVRVMTQSRFSTSVERTVIADVRGSGEA